MENNAEYIQLTLGLMGQLHVRLRHMNIPQPWCVWHILAFERGDLVIALPFSWKVSFSRPFTPTWALSESAVAPHLFVGCLVPRKDPGWTPACLRNKVHSLFLKDTLRMMWGFLQPLIMNAVETEINYCPYI